MTDRATALALLSILALAAAPLRAQESLPIPYTAEQIRDAYTKGSRVVTHTWTAAAEIRSVTTVTAWSEDAVSMSDQPIDERGRPTGEPAVFDSTWTELRDHARFPAETAERERVRRETPLGTLEGWLYTVAHGPDDRSSFFFADRYPGPPVVYQRTTAGELVMRAEIIERTTGE